MNERLHSDGEILSTVRRHWGYESLRPMQEQAIRAGLELRDSLVVIASRRAGSRTIHGCRKHLTLPLT